MTEEERTQKSKVEWGEGNETKLGRMASIIYPETLFTENGEQ